MPKVRQLDWSKLKPATPEKSRLGTNHFPVYQYKEATKNSRNSATKITKPSILPHPFKCSECTFIGETKKEANQHYFAEHS